MPPMGVTIAGKVKRWDSAKGFGFLIPEGGGPDVFVHARELTDGEMLVDGAPVTFICEQDAQKGPGRFRAKNCTGAIPKSQSPPPVAEVPRDNLFIAGLPLEFGEDQVQATFSQYGTVLSVKKLPVQPGKNDCAALVRMGSVEQAQWLVENVNQNIPNGLTTKVTVRYAESKGKGGGKGKGGPPMFGMQESLQPGLVNGAGGFGKADAPSLSVPNLGPYDAAGGGGGNDNSGGWNGGGGGGNSRWS